MAEGLFGPSPWEIQQTQQQAMVQNAAAYAQQSPLERAAAGMYQAGGMLGGMAAGALGGKNVAVEQAKRQEQIMGSGDEDLGTSAGMAAKADQFRKAGDLRTATALTLKANEMKRQEVAAALAQQKQDETEKFRRDQMTETMEIKRQQLQRDLERDKRDSEDRRLSVEQRDTASKRADATDRYLGQLAAEMKRMGIEAKTAAAGAGGTAPPKNLTREARLGWELENGMIDQSTYDAAMSASPGGVLRQKQVESANTARSSFEAVKRNIDQLYDAQSGSLKPAAQSLFGQYAQYRPEMSMSQESVDAKLALEGLTDQVMMANLADAKARVGQSFGSMQVQEWDKFTQQLTSLKRGLSEKQAAESMKYVLNFIKTKGNVLETALSKPNTVSPPAVKPQAPSDFNSKWAALKSGQSLVGPDGKTYTKN